MASRRYAKVGITICFIALATPELVLGQREILRCLMLVGSYSRYLSITSSLVQAEDILFAVALQNDTKILCQSEACKELNAHNLSKIEGNMVHLVINDICAVVNNTVFNCIIINHGNISNNEGNSTIITHSEDQCRPSDTNTTTAPLTTTTTEATITSEGPLTTTNSTLLTNKTQPTTNEKKDDFVNHWKTRAIVSFFFNAVLLVIVLVLGVCVYKNHRNNQNGNGERGYADGTAELNQNGNGVRGNDGGTTELNQNGNGERGNDGGTTELNQIGNGESGNDGSTTGLNQNGNGERGNDSDTAEFNQNGNGLFDDADSTSGTISLLEMEYLM